VQEEVGGRIADGVIFALNTATTFKIYTDEKIIQKKSIIMVVGCFCIVRVQRQYIPTWRKRIRIDQNG